MLGAQEAKTNTAPSSTRVQQNQRKFIRVRPAMDHPIMVDVNGENFIDIFHAKDISEAGIGIKVPHFFDGCAIEKPVNFIISLPEPCNKIIQAKGIVKHAADEYFGVYFTKLDSLAVKYLREYISSRIADEGEWIKSLAFKLGFIH